MSNDITALSQTEINDALAQLKQLSEYPTPSTQYARVLRKYITSLVEALEAKLPHHNGMMQLSNELVMAKQRIAELENDEVRQRLANAEHQLHMAELAKHNLKASRKAQFRKRKVAEKRIAELEKSRNKLRDGMAAIYNAICADGASTSVSAILTFVKRAHEESATAGIQVIEGEA